MLVTPSGIVTDVRLLQDKNVSNGIAVMFLDSVTDFNSVHSENTWVPMLTTLSGIIICVRLRHLLNAASPILVTLFGITIDVRLLHPKNVPSCILVTLLGTVIPVILSQLKNAPLLMLFTLSGI